jgi:hypothetical protein
MPVETEQEKSDENMDKSGPYDDKRNIFACEEDYRPKATINYLRAVNATTREADDLETDDYSICSRILLALNGAVTPGPQ